MKKLLMITALVLALSSAKSYAQTTHTVYARLEFPQDYWYHTQEYLYMDVWIAFYSDPDFTQPVVLPADVTFEYTIEKNYSGNSSYTESSTHTRTIDAGRHQLVIGDDVEMEYWHYNSDGSYDAFNKYYTLPQSVFTYTTCH